MSFGVLVVMLIVAGIAVMSVANRQEATDENQRWPYLPRRVLNKGELVLYHRLRLAMPNLLVLTQVNLSSVIAVEKNNNFGQWFNKINRLNCDFVVCKKDGTPLAIIELDGPSHRAPKRREADARKDKAVTSAGIKVFRWTYDGTPNDDALKNMGNEFLGLTEKNK